MRNYKFALQAQAGVSENIPAKGDFFRYDRITSGLTAPDIVVTMLGGSGGEVLLKPGQSFRLPQAADGFKVANHAGSVAIEGLLLIGEGEFNDSNISGEVTVTDARADALTLPGTVTVGTAEVLALALKAARKLAVFTAEPSNTDIVVLGPTGLTTTTSPIILQAGESWKEEIAAAAAWYARSGSAGQGLRIMEAE